MTELEVVNLLIENNVQSIDKLLEDSRKEYFDPFSYSNSQRRLNLDVLKQSLKNLEKEKRSLLRQAKQQKSKTHKLKESPPGSGNYISD